MKLNDLTFSSVINRINYIRKWHLPGEGTFQAITTPEKSKEYKVNKILMFLNLNKKNRFSGLFIITGGMIMIDQIIINLDPSSRIVFPIGAYAIGMFPGKTF
jgi:hypothetical protein